LLDVLDHIIFVSAAGELADVAFAVGLNEARLPDVLAMTERKTSAYSFAGPLAAGAILAGAGGDTLAGLDEYGRMLGVAFQLGDDLLGVFGEEDVTGKSVVGDLRQGKETSLIAYARRTPQWHRIEPWFGRRDLGAADAHRVAALLQECGARGFVEHLVRQHVDAALLALQTPAFPDGLREELGDVARGCIGRIS
jgi:geranylgeranyl diphosphate synthase type II